MCGFLRCESHNRFQKKLSILSPEFSRYEKLARRSEAFIAIAAAWIWLTYCQYYLG